MTRMTRMTTFLEIRIRRMSLVRGDFIDDDAKSRRKNPAGAIFFKCAESALRLGA